MNYEQDIYNRYRDIETLKKRLESKNVKTDNYTNIILSNISYSNLIKGLKKTKFVNEDGKFLEEVSCDDILNLFILDKDFSNFIFKYILYVETFLNSNLSIIIASNFGSHSSQKKEDIKNPSDFLYVNNYANTQDKIKTLYKLKKRIQKPLEGTSMSYFKKNKTYYPPWVLFNSIYLSDTISIIKILKSIHKTELITKMLPHQSILSDEDKKNMFLMILNCIKKYRNHLAHPNLILKKQVNSDEFLPFSQIQEYTNNKLINSNVNKRYKESVIYSLPVCLTVIINSNNLIKTDFLKDLFIIINKNKDFKFMEYDLYEIFNIPNTIYEDILRYFSSI